jgi:hypothetical protein
MSKNLNIDKIKVCDSKLAALSFFTQELRDLYNDPKIVFKQSDLTREGTRKNYRLCSFYEFFFF